MVIYQNDHLGTPQKLTAVNGAVVWSAKFSSFGEADVDPGSSVVNPLRFSGQYEDTETGLYYNWYRYYIPSTGRYLKVDPIGFYGGQANLYGYTSNNPVVYIDPLGLGKIGAIIGGAIGAGVGIAVGTLETVGTFGGGIVIAPAIVAGSAAIGSGIGHYAEEGIRHFFESSIWDDIESDVPDSAVDDVTTPDDNVIVGPWPDSGVEPDAPPIADDQVRKRLKRHEHCRRLYELCDSQRWPGNCSSCLTFCETQGFWDYGNCPACPAK